MSVFYELIQQYRKRTCDLIQRAYRVYECGGKSGDGTVKITFPSIWEDGNYTIEVYAYPLGDTRRHQFKSFEEWEKFLDEQEKQLDEDENG